MKIIKIISGDKAPKAVDVRDHCLYLFSTPVIFSTSGKDRIYGGSTAVLYADGRKPAFRAVSGKPMKYVMVSFRPSAADRQYMSGMDIPLNVPVELADDFTIASAIKALSVHRETAGKRRAEVCELYMRLIFISLEGAKGVQAEERTVPKYAQLKRIRDDIYAMPAREWNVDEMCRRIAVSRPYFHRIYMEAFGVSFMRDVIEARLTLAAELLTTTELSVSAVAEKCGYESDSYFMRQFKKYRGCTPSEYRASRAMHNA